MFSPANSDMLIFCFSGQNFRASPFGDEESVWLPPFLLQLRLLLRIKESLQFADEAIS